MLRCITSFDVMKQLTWEVYAFVDATPISGPALMWTPQWDSRLMVEPTVLVIPTMRAPRCLQYLNALRVSAVSPDWDMKKQTSSLNLKTFRYTYCSVIDIKIDIQPTIFNDFLVNVQQWITPSMQLIFSCYLPYQKISLTFGNMNMNMWPIMC